MQLKLDETEDEMKTMKRRYASNIKVSHVDATLDFLRSNIIIINLKSIFFQG